ncbi:hypothetical protein DL767_000621 [Monosporascus sp. MG133]|nr:hypothetical protein DL767_000621 [Monosporascus sp. MG133]
MFRVLGFLTGGKSPKSSDVCEGDLPTDTLGGADRARLELASQRKANGITRELLKIHSRLARLSDFQPGEETNEIFSRLVSLCCEIHDTETVNKVFGDDMVQAILPPLRKMCSDAEYCLEDHWAKYITAAPSTDEAIGRLKSFTYYKNYEDLTRHEICAMLSANPVLPGKVAFIGSGPLPLTSLCFLEALKKRALPGNRADSENVRYPANQSLIPEILNIDRDGAAVESASVMCAKLGSLGDGMKFQCAPAGGEALDLHDFDLVYIAALVGGSQNEKEGLLHSVAAKMREGALIIMRTSWGLRSCLYPEVDMATEEMLQRVEICSVVHPYGSVVNSIIVARIRSPPKPNGDTNGNIPLITSLVC